VGILILVNSKKDYLMEKANIMIKMEMFLMENLKMEKKKVKVC
jgi:hypothetical protein